MERRHGPGRPLAVDGQRRLLRGHGRRVRGPAAAESVLSAVETREALRFGPVDIAFDGSVLRPRPWTLAQSEWAAALAGEGPILEVGCGAGHIGLAASVLSGAGLVQVDRDPAACRWAATNAAANGREASVDQRCGTVGDQVSSGELFTVVVADPPYVPTAQVGLYPADPLGAIDGGADGLDSVRGFLADIAGHVAPGGSILLQLRGLRQVAEVEGWLAHPTSPALQLAEARSYGELRALARLVPGCSPPSP